MHTTQYRINLADHRDGNLLLAVFRFFVGRNKSDEAATISHANTFDRAIGIRYDTVYLAIR